MTGFKKGAAASGFDDDEDEADAAGTATTAESEQTDDPQKADVSAVAEAAATETEPTDSSADRGAGEAQLPWIYRRDNARDGRPRTKQIHLQPSTAEREGAFRSEVESVLGESVNLTDLREAALLVAMDHTEEVATQLQEWGYDVK